MLYKKRETKGAWINKEELKVGQVAKLVSATEEVDGKYGKQDVAKLRIKDQDEVVNVALNKTTINALIDAFGEDSKNWTGQVLTIYTEQTRIAGKQVAVLYLIPEGYEFQNDENGFAKIVNPNKKDEPALPPDLNEDNLSPEDIPF